jgi:hypothetical protein
VPEVGAMGVCLGASVCAPASGALCGAPFAEAMPGRLGERRRAKRVGCACAGRMRAGCVFRVRRVKPVLLCPRERAYSADVLTVAVGPGQPLRICLRGGRSKRGGKRVKAALQASGGKSTAAARFPVKEWEGGKRRAHGGSVAPARAGSGGYHAGPADKGFPSYTRVGADRAAGAERASTLHLPVRDRAADYGTGAGAKGGMWAKSKKKMSKRQLANAARARHRGSFLEGLLAQIDPGTLTQDPVRIRLASLF